MSFFAHKVVLITGGAAGIGRALGASLIAAGARVYLADVDGDLLRETVAGLAEAAEQGSPGRLESVELDVTDAERFHAVIDEIVSRHGGIDFLFNNAGVGATGEAQDLPSGAWDRLIDVNLRGTVNGVRAAYPHMLKRGSGHIANIACAAGLVPFPMTVPYSATKHGVVGLSGALRAEAADKGVRVSVICPGVVDTDMFDSIEYFGVDKEALLSPASRAMMSPEACARRILRGLRKNRAVITVGLSSRLVWWLYRLAPGAFLRLAQTGFGIFRRRLQP